MSLLEPTELKRLAQLRSENGVIVSLYLNVDGRKYSHKQNYEAELKILIKQALKQWTENGQLSKEWQTALKDDLNAIYQYVTGEFQRQGYKGLVIFKSGPGKIWQVYPLAVTVPTRLIISQEAYTKILSTILDEHKRFCTVVVDRKKARYFTVYLGQIEEHQGVFVNEWVPDKVKEGEWAGLKQSRIARHIEDHVLHHLKECAEFTFNFFQAHHFDYLILGGHKEITTKFEALLHPYLKARLAGVFVSEPDSSLTQILAKSLQVEEEIEKAEEEKVLSKLTEAAKGLTVVGLKETVAALNKGQVSTLVIKDSFYPEGWYCLKDYFLAVKDGNCPVCGERLTFMQDLSEALVQTAIERHAKVETIMHLNFPQQVGALLRWSQRLAAS
jgi:peptide subunit release factor 1 (eRF1)